MRVEEERSIKKRIIFFVYEYNIVLIRKVIKSGLGKKIQYSILALLSPLFLVKMIFDIVYEHTVGRYNVIKQVKSENKLEYKYEFGIMMSAKNEAKYIREWIRYYKEVGVDIIYLIDNESEDDLKGKIKDYIEEGFVQYSYVSGARKQIIAYNEIIRSKRNEVRYLAAIDCDEFLVSHNSYYLKEKVCKIFENNKGIGGIGVNWVIYGSSGKKLFVDEPVIGRFLFRSEYEWWGNRHIKTIVNPRLVKCFISPHFPIYKKGAWSISTSGKRQRLWYCYDMDFDELCCNHYFGKSYEEFRNKKARGLGTRPEQYDYDDIQFEKYDRNEVYDDTMLKYLDKIKE